MRGDAAFKAGGRVQCSPLTPLPPTPPAKRGDVPPVIPVFITLDPARDTCAQVGAYVADFHPAMLGLTGTPGQVAKVAKAFRVYFSEVDNDGDSEDYLGA